MFKALFSIIINLMATIIQIVMTPLNLIVTNALPEVSDKILSVTSSFGTIFDNINWATGLLPPAVTDVLLFILVCEVAKHTIFISTHTLVKVWNIFQKLKFW